jgi:hypothetical protein
VDCSKHGSKLSGSMKSDQYIMKANIIQSDRTALHPASRYVEIAA